MCPALVDRIFSTTTQLIREYQFFQKFTIYFHFRIDKKRAVYYNNIMVNQS